MYCYILACRLMIMIIKHCEQSFCKSCRLGILGSDKNINCGIFEIGVKLVLKELSPLSTDLKTTLYAWRYNDTKSPYSIILFSKSLLKLQTTWIVWFVWERKSCRHFYWDTRFVFLVYWVLDGYWILYLTLGITIQTFISGIQWIHYLAATKRGIFLMVFVSFLSISSNKWKLQMLWPGLLFFITKRDHRKIIRL